MMMAVSELDRDRKIILKKYQVASG